MSKRKYRAVSIKDIDASGVGERLGTSRVVVAIDVAKEDFYAAVMDESRTVVVTVKWKHPVESPLFVGLVKELAVRGTVVEAAMEPTGVYGDAVRSALLGEGIEVFRVSPKRSHDAAEVYDGVPSWHDAKSAAIIGKLHLDGASERWPVASAHERRLVAALRMLELHQMEFHRNRNRLEAQLARHWPEASEEMDLGSATLLDLLSEYGGPGPVAAKPKKARELMRRIGKNFLTEDKIDALVESASSTFGMPQIAEERKMVMAIAAETRRQQKAARKAQQCVEKLSESEGATREMAPVLGKTTAAVLVASVGSPEKYESAPAYVKSLGLNLKEKSSGKQQGVLQLTKRGPGVARRFLYLAALRLIQADPIVRAWYAKKVHRDGGHKQKGVIAIMRKLGGALWHVARGEAFDSRKLFDTSRLNLEKATA